MSANRRKKKLEARSVDDFKSLLEKHEDEITRLELSITSDFFVLRQNQTGEMRKILNIVRLSRKGALFLATNMNNLSITVERNVNGDILELGLRGKRIKALQFLGLRFNPMGSLRRIASVESLHLTNLDTLTRNFTFYRIDSLVELSVYGLPSRSSEKEYSLRFLKCLTFASYLKKLRLVVSGNPTGEHKLYMEVAVNLSEGLCVSPFLGLHFPRMNREISIRIEENLFNSDAQMFFLRHQLSKNVNLDESKRCVCNGWNMLADLPRELKEEQ